MKKRSPLSQSKLRIKPAPDPFPEPKEVSFWLVKMDPELYRRIDSFRKMHGHNKKETVRRMALALLNPPNQDPFI